MKYNFGNFKKTEDFTIVTVEIQTQIAFQYSAESYLPTLACQPRAKHPLTTKW